MPRGLIFFLLPLACGAQSSIAPEDLCSIEGQVLDAVTGAPVRKATVLFRRIEANPSAFGNFSTVSDAAGKFAMKDIEPGQYRLTVDRTGFVNMEYGARSPGRTGAILSLSRAQSLKDLVVRLTPHGVVAGRVVDQDGDAVAALGVQLERYRYVNGVKQLAPSGSVTFTNDLGEYRLFGVAPGKYYLSATYREGADGALDRSATSQPDEDYVPTYYPGTIEATTAAELNVMPGSELRNFNFALSKTRTVRLRGRVSALAVLGRGFVSLRPRGRITGPFSNRPYPIDSNGRFEIRGVAPGSYFLEVRLQGGQSARQPIEVGKGNMDDIALSVSTYLSIQGRVRIDPEATTGMSGVRITLQSLESGGIFGNLPNTNLNSDRTFQLELVSPDRYNVVFTGLPEGFYVKAIRSGDADVLASGLDLTNGAGADLEVVLSPKAGQLSGVVQNSKTQQPAPGAFVVLIPQEKERRDQQSYYKTTTTDQTGSFILKSLVPGTYKAFAWEDIENGAYMDPDFVKPFESSGESVSVVESASSACSSL
jgi:5-hydroxyisourate hydrolase-like protein (transthyretin family)